MKFGLVARDVRLLVALLVLCLTAVVLVVTSWPSSNDLASPRRAASVPFVETTPSRSDVPSEGRRVARRFAEAYFTATSYSAAIRRRLEPYSSDELIAAMRVNSGALALGNSSSRETNEAEVVALQTQDGTEGHALVAIVERSMRANGKTWTELLTVTLELVEDDGEWFVTEVLVP